VAANFLLVYFKSSRNVFIISINSNNRLYRVKYLVTDQQVSFHQSYIAIETLALSWAGLRMTCFSKNLILLKNW